STILGSCFSLGASSSAASAVLPDCIAGSATASGWARLIREPLRISLWRLWIRDRRIGRHIGKELAQLVSFDLVFRLLECLLFYACADPVVQLARRSLVLVLFAAI